MGNCSSGNTVAAPSKYKLTYFGVKGRAEFIRMLFEQAGVEYEDCRIQFGEQWNNLKPKTPLGSLPLLHVNGTCLVQSMSIGRFLAREFKLCGANYFEMAQVDCILETIVEIQNGIGPLLSEKDEDKKAELRIELEPVLKPKLCVLDKMLENNGGGAFVGKTITVADISFYCTCCEFIPDNGWTDVLKDFPKLEALGKKVAKEPRIAAWIAKRPDTPF